MKLSDFDTVQAKVADLRSIREAIKYIEKAYGSPKFSVTMIRDRSDYTQGDLSVGYLFTESEIMGVLTERRESLITELVALGVQDTP